jgi:ATP-dependent DNA ligase
LGSRNQHDGFRIMVRRDGAGVRLITRHGNDFTARFPLAVEAASASSARSFLLDGEAIVTNERVGWRFSTSSAISATVTMQC